MPTCIGTAGRAVPSVEDTRLTLVRSVRSRNAKAGVEERTMLETIAIILIILWLLGMVSGYTLGNFIYILLVIAVVLFLVRLISGRRV